MKKLAWSLLALMVMLSVIIAFQLREPEIIIVDKMVMAPTPKTYNVIEMQKADDDIYLVRILALSTSFGGQKVKIRHNGGLIEGCSAFYVGAGYAAVPCLVKLDAGDTISFIANLN